MGQVFEHENLKDKDVKYLLTKAYSSFTNPYQK